jgi:transcriptional regulator with XRE-family HTH domain
MFFLYAGYDMEDRALRDVLGQNLKNFRKKRNWSQSDLAECAGISITFLSDIERGNKWPYPGTLSNMAKALGIEVYELFLTDCKTTKTPSNETARAIIEDVSLTLQKSVNRAMNQSLEKIKKQYS